MTGKDRIFTVMKNQRADKVPWVPFAGVHAGKLKGYSAKEVLTDPNKLTESLLEVNKIYQPDGQPVVFDLQVEAEILGCELLWSEEGPPVVTSHPLIGETRIFDNIPNPQEGRLPVILESMANIKKGLGETTALYGLICGPFTLAGHLAGTDLFMDMVMNQERVDSFLKYTLKIAKAMTDYYLEAGMDILGVVDPLISQISPSYFSRFMEETFKALFYHIRLRGALSSFFVCGNASANIEGMCKTNPDSISVDENVNLPQAKEITDRYNIVIGGNIPLTTVMLFGTQQDNMKAVLDILDSTDSRNLIISPGCDMPYDTPIENCIALGQTLRQPDQARKILSHYKKQDLIFTGKLPDYANLHKPLIEVFTLDSATCAACTYMLASAMEAKEYFRDSIEVIEYKYTTPENIARMAKMGIKQLPSIYINGELAYSSIIPDRKKLISQIEVLLR